MNANLMPPMPVIKDHRHGGVPLLRDWLNDASHQLAKIGISSSVLDAEIILANILGKDRTYLHAHPEQLISLEQQKIANKNLKLRLKRVPIAYITGDKEFYGRNFLVSPAVLIPRPESEIIIKILADVLEKAPEQHPLKLVDVGTGSGCLGITAKLEFPKLEVTLLDISNKALKIATENATNLSAKVTLIKSNLLQKYSDQPDIIIANLPYVDKTWNRSPETNFEPDLALFADDNGLYLIKKLIIQSSQSLKTDGLLIFEADEVQHNSLIEFSKQNGFELVQQKDFIIAFKLHL